MILYLQRDPPGWASPNGMVRRCKSIYDLPAGVPIVILMNDATEDHFDEVCQLFYALDFLFKK